jgi:hypothetical protein
MIFETAWRKLPGVSGCISKVGAALAGRAE